MGRPGPENLPVAGRVGVHSCSRVLQLADGPGSRGRSLISYAFRALGLGLLRVRYGVWAVRGGTQDDAMLGGASALQSPRGIYPVAAHPEFSPGGEWLT